MRAATSQSSWTTPPTTWPCGSRWARWARWKSPSTRPTTAMLEHQLAVGQASDCIVDAASLPAVLGSAPNLPQLERIIVRGSNEAGALPARCRPFDALTVSADESDLGRSIPHDSLAGIIFTSGTTGPSKGVLLTHHYVTAYGYMYADINGLRDDDVVMNFLPFFHIG